MDIYSYIYTYTYTSCSYGIQDIDAIANKRRCMPHGRLHRCGLLCNPLLDCALGPSVVGAGNGPPQDVARAGVDLEVEERRVQQNVCGVVQRERCNTVHAEFARCLLARRCV